MPGVEHVEHVYFFGAAIADPPRIEEYLRRAYVLGRDFAEPAAVAGEASPAGAGESASITRVIAYVDADARHLYAPGRDAAGARAPRPPRDGQGRHRRCREAARRGPQPRRSPRRSHASSPTTGGRRASAHSCAGLRQFGERARDQAADLRATIDTSNPTCSSSMRAPGAPPPRPNAPACPGRLAGLGHPADLARRPTLRLGLRPRHDRIGRLRDRTARALTLGSLERVVARQVNGARAELGVGPFTTIDASYLAADAILAYTAEPFESRAPTGPARSTSSAPASGNRHDAPSWLDDLRRPLVLVTCSTLFQNDRRLAEVACHAFTGAPYDVVITIGEIDPDSFSAPDNVRIKRFVHTPVLERAMYVICHAGMGIAQKALAHGVPVVAVPFGRDQPEVARRVDVARAGVRLPAHRLSPQRLAQASSRRARSRPAHGASPTQVPRRRRPARRR